MQRDREGGGPLTSAEVLPTEANRLGEGKKPSLTVVAAMLNERDHLESWLENLDWVDRIILIDHGSKDGSLEIARSQPRCECISAPEGEGLIEDIRSLGLEAVNEGWVLVLDLDERVSQGLKEEITDLLSREQHADGYLIPFRHYVFGHWLRYGGWDDKHLRLFKSGKGHYTPGKIHADAVVEGEVESLEQAVLHYAHPTIHDFIMRMNRYTTQSAEVLANGKPGGLRKRVRLPESRWRWFQASASFFWTRFIKHRGFRDGMPGFIIAFLLAAYLFVEQAKAWEFARENSR
ncbi:MAG: hypothetical protein CBC13_09065 [Planctomycetia bacterium TMED53]|nr:MAG: hypothetical protein CBC13_09065 [Planctomycetia bacterium TMED53]